MNKEILEQLKDNLQGVQQGLSKLSMTFEKDIADNPNSTGQQAKKDIVNVIKAAKNGNFEEVMKLQKRYADKFNK